MKAAIEHLSESSDDLSDEIDFEEEMDMSDSEENEEYENIEEDEDMEEDEQDNNQENQNKHANEKHVAMQSIMNRILNKPIKDTQPILSKAKGIEKKLEQEKELEKAHRLIVAEKRMHRDKEHVKPDLIRDFEKEKRLKRIATRGVVKLFNALKKQNHVETKLKKEAKTTYQEKQAENTSKDVFLEFLTKSQENQKNTWDVLDETPTVQDWDQL